MPGVDATAGLSMGLWRYRQHRLYGSTGLKPATAARAVLGKSKIVPAPYQDRLVGPKHNTQVWNHQFIELFVAAVQLGDRRPRSLGRPRARAPMGSALLEGHHCPALAVAPRKAGRRVSVAHHAIREHGSIVARGRRRWVGVSSLGIDTSECPAQ